MTRRHPSNGRSRASADPPGHASTNGDSERESADVDHSTPVRIPAPAWVPTDDVIGQHTDRQVLVVGSTPVGMTLTLLLDAAGYDPVLVDQFDARTASRLTHLSPAALEVLGSLHLGARLHDCGRAIRSVTVRRGRGSDANTPVDAATAEAPDSGRAPAIVIPTRTLNRTLRDRVSSAATIQRRAIGSISRRDDRIAVTFDDGVRESFDVVVDVRGEPIRTDGRNPDSEYRQYETVVSDAPDEHRIRDCWSSEAVVQRLPRVAESGDLVRVTVPDDGDDGRDAQRVPSNVPGVPEAAAFERRRVLQRQLTEGNVPDEWWGDGRLAYCGPGACPAAPATGVGQPMGITDALGLVSALTRDVDARSAVAQYAAARAERFDGLRRVAARGDYPLSTPGTTDSQLGSIRLLRAMALEPFFGEVPGPLGVGDPR